MVAGRSRRPRASTCPRWPVKAGVAVAGVAWAQHRGISKVEVQGRPAAVDRGAARRRREHRHVAAVGLRVGRDPGQPRHPVRAYDDKGQVQSPLEAPPAPNGATGIHVVNVTAG